MKGGDRRCEEEVRGDRRRKGEEQRGREEQEVGGARAAIV